MRALNVRLDTTTTNHVLQSEIELHSINPYNKHVCFGLSLRVLGFGSKELPIAFGGSP